MTSCPHQQDINKVHRCLETGRSIYIGNIQSARNPKILKSQKLSNLEYGIKAIISVARDTFLPYSSKQLPDYLYIPALDRSYYPIEDHFEQTFEFIENNIKKTNVLVHCVAGISRSASIVIAYLMKKHRIGFKEAREKISYWRSVIKPNTGFVGQLKRYQKLLEISSIRSHSTHLQQHDQKQKQKLNSNSQHLTLKNFIQQENLTSVTRNRPLTNRTKHTCIKQKLQEIELSQVRLEQQLLQLRQSFLETSRVHEKLKGEIEVKERKRVSTSVSEERMVKLLIVK